MPLDDADKKVIADLIAAAMAPEKIAPIVKAHVDAGLKDSPKGDDLKKLVSESVGEALKAAKPADDKGKDDKGKSGDAGNPEVAQLKAQFEQERTARLAAEAKAKTDALHSAARAALAKAGVPGDRIEHAMAYLKDKGLLDYASTGSPGWKGKDQYNVDAVLDMEAGAKAWLQTTDGKHYLPPEDVRGTGDGAGGRGGRSGSGPLNLTDLRGNQALGAGLLSGLLNQ